MVPGRPFWQRTVPRGRLAGAAGRADPGRHPVPVRRL